MLGTIGHRTFSALVFCMYFLFISADFAATPGSVTVTLANSDEIPNRDFVLSWRQTADTIEESTFTHTSESQGDWSGTRVRSWLAMAMPILAAVMSSSPKALANSAG